MELDDLRRQWQQPEAAGVPAVNTAQLDQLLAGRSEGLAEKMRRNTWYEIIVCIVVMMAAPLLLLDQTENTLFRVYVMVSEGLVIVLLYHYYRQLGLLRSMTQADVNVRAHLGALGAGLRQLLRFYYRLTLATLPLVLLLDLGYFVSRELAHPGPFRWALLGLVVGSFMLLGALAQWGLVAATRWYLQRLYGQHLDRLEASLAELAEPALPG